MPEYNLPNGDVAYRAFQWPLAQQMFRHESWARRIRFLEQQITPEELVETLVDEVAMPEINKLLRTDQKFINKVVGVYVTHQAELSHAEQ